MAPPTYGAASASTTFTDPNRPGSVWQQALVGVVGVVLAIILVVGQISVATTAGIQQNLHTNIENLAAGNETMKSIVRKAAPTIAMEKVVALQQRTLAHTRQTMRLLNGQMATIGTTTGDLSGTVDSMRSSSNTLASGVDGMNRDTQRIVKLLGGLPPATERTHKHLGRIADDTAAINGELETISKRMEGYGLPHAQGVRGE